VALFDPRDGAHAHARDTLATFDEDLVTTVPVLTEAFHLLGPAGPGARALREFVAQRGLCVWWLAAPHLARAFQLMDEYADHPMDLADASLVAAAEDLRSLRVFTIDRQDFLAYRVRIGRRLRAFTLL
jgi:predicted nucleic acid-binding protein